MTAAGQHRLARVQLVNWGTFNGWFDLPVPRDGLLITGPSGSGKSSLLDALAAVLVQPRWLQFNAAAQEGGAGDRSRSLVSYVRGAYKREADEASGEVSTAYLRTGATWSGVALTFADERDTATSLVRLMHLPRGSNAASDLASLFLLVEGPVDLLALEPFAKDGLDQRRLKAGVAGATVFPQYSGFAVRLQRRLGLASDQAQRLLHKTQSAKNLTSLDTLLREFMLDVPDTFDLVTQATEQFGELRAAHAGVVDARRQVETLTPLRALQREQQQLEAARADVEAQTAHLDAVRLGVHLERADADLAALGAQVAALDAEVVRAEHEVAARQDDRDAARRAVDGLGGRELAALEVEAAHQTERLAAVRRQRARLDDVARACGLTLPDRADEVDGFLGRVEQAHAALAEDAAQREERHRLSGAHGDARRARERLERELETLTRQKSTLDEGLLAVRSLLLEASGVGRERLPFAGELISVRPDEAEWTGAIERVLRPFARTLLVPDDLYPLVSEVVDERHLGVRLVYERVPDADVVAPAVADPRSLVLKVAVAASEFSGWVEGELARRFDHACVASVAELRAVTRGVTRAGQVRHSGTRHEKDDRSRVDDRRQWVLGSSGDAKRAALEQELAAARRAESSALTVRDRAEAERDERQGLTHRLGELQHLAWDEVDVGAASRLLDELVARADAVRAANVGLAEAQAALDRATRAARDAETTLGATRERRARAAQRRDDLARRREGWVSELTSLPQVPAEVRAHLLGRFGAQPGDPDAAARQIRAELDRDQRRIIQRLANAEQRAASVMQAYKYDWPGPAADLIAQADNLPDFLAILDGLQADRLPEFEDRFFDLLQGQSRNNIGALSQRLKNARREVRERVDPINRSLRQTEYSPGRYLHVRVDDRRLPEVTTFLQTLTEITSGSLEDALGSALGPEARVAAEARFLTMERLLQRLASTAPDDQRWRQQCLDTRLHVQFVAEVRDDDGRAVDYFTGAGGLSGGERQKLVTFCLAAALRYQLAREGADLPAYGLVVLDEAFDKTDPAFTRAGLDVFRTFGFQLLLATPLKMLQTLEDYVGGAAVVLNESGRGSRFEVMLFEADADTELPVPIEQETLL